jgi:hypothetical protein
MCSSRHRSRHAVQPYRPCYTMPPTLSTAIEMYRTMDIIFWLPAAAAALAQVA